MSEMEENRQNMENGESRQPESNEDAELNNQNTRNAPNTRNVQDVQDGRNLQRGKTGISAYYRASFRALTERRWLVLLPLGFVLANWSLGVLLDFLIGSRYPALWRMQHFPIVPYNPYLFKALLSDVLLQSPDYLQFAYIGAMFGSIALLILTILVLVFQRPLMAFLSRQTGETAAASRPYVSTFLMAAGLLFLVLLITAGIGAIVKSRLLVFIAVPVAFLVLKIAETAVFALILGGIISGFRDALAGVAPTFGRLAANSLDAWRPLFAVLLVLLSMDLISATLAAGELAGGLLYRGEAAAVVSAMSRIQPVLNWLNVLIVLLGIAAPAAVIVERNENARPLGKILKDLAVVISQNAGHYLLLIISGLALVLIAPVVKIALYFISIPIIGRVFLDLVFDSALVLAGALFYGALVEFYRNRRVPGKQE